MAAGRGLPAPRVRRGHRRRVAGDGVAGRSRRGVCVAHGGPRRRRAVRADRAPTGAGGRMIKAVISDFGGVLTNPLWEAFAGWNENVGADPGVLGQALQRASEERGEHPLYELEKGQLTEDEFTAIVQAQLPDDIELAGFRDIYFSHLHAN